MREFAKRNITFTFVKVNESCNTMIKVMEDNYNPSGNHVNVTDLAKACQTKTAAEVTNEFVKATSYILSAAVGGVATTGKGKKVKPLKAIKRTTKPLWDTKKFEEDQFLSQTAYLRATAIDGDRITVENSFGTALYVSKDILEGMWSADHFKSEINMGMSSLAELLHTVQDHVFTIHFRKNPTEGHARELLENFNSKAPKALPELVKEMVGGEPCTMTCHMIEVENNLGRSLVIDLNAKTDNKFRQVDHRTIEWIVFQNVKYVLKKSGTVKLEDAMEMKKKDKDAPKWDSSKLAVGNWFSGTSYYKADKIEKDTVICSNKDKRIEISRDIIEYEMHNASVFATEEKIPLTQVATKITEANNTCFTVCFTCKVKEADVKEQLEALSQKQIKSKAKDLAKELLVGREQTLVGRLSKAEGKLGRSLIIDLPTQGYRQVDHRTIKHLIIKNIKYNVTKK